jgi:hypothetical protein
VTVVAEPSARELALAIRAHANMRRAEEAEARIKTLERQVRRLGSPAAQAQRVRRHREAGIRDFAQEYLAAGRSSAPITDLGLPARCVSYLRSHGVSTAQQLRCLRDHGLAFTLIDGIGPGFARSISEAIA